MCESDVYFETYRHVYEVLKNFNEQSFPLRNYIIDVDVSSMENVLRSNFLIYFTIILDNPLVSRVHSKRRKNCVRLQKSVVGY